MALPVLRRLNSDPQVLRDDHTLPDRRPTRPVDRGGIPADPASRPQCPPNGPGGSIPSGTHAWRLSMGRRQVVESVNTPRNHAIRLETET